MAFCTILPAHMKKQWNIMITNDLAREIGTKFIRMILTRNSKIIVIRIPT